MVGNGGGKPTKKKKNTRNLNDDESVTKTASSAYSIEAEVNSRPNKFDPSETTMKSSSGIAGSQNSIYSNNNNTDSEPNSLRRSNRSKAISTYSVDNSSGGSNFEVNTFTNVMKSQETIRYLSESATLNALQDDDDVGVEEDDRMIEKVNLKPVSKSRKNPIISKKPIRG